MSGTSSRVTRDGLVVGNCYTGDNGRYLGKLKSIDTAKVMDPDVKSGRQGGLVEEKTYVFDGKTLVISGLGMDGGPFFTQVECRGGAPAAAFLGSGGAMGGAGGGGASSASSANAPVSTGASEKLKQNLRTTVLPDGTQFIVGKEFLDVEEPYFIVTIRAPGVSRLDDKLYKIVLRDLSIRKFFGMSDTTPERFDALQAIVGKFQPRANNASRRSARKQRKSRRANRKRGSRRRTH